MDAPEFEQLVKKIRPVMLTMVRKIVSDMSVAEDVTQDTFLRLWSMRGRLDGYSSVEALAMIVARNIAIDHTRASRPVMSIDDVHDISASSSVAADAAIIAGDTAREVDEIMASLAPGQRAIIKMKHVDGLEINEIARITGSTENSVRVTLCRARSRVKELFMKRQMV